MGKLKTKSETVEVSKKELKTPELSAKEGVVKKKKKYRGKKKKKSDSSSAGTDGVKVTSVAPPKLKALQKENISSNWKSLLQTLVKSPSSAPEPGKPSNQSTARPSKFTKSDKTKRAVKRPAEEKAEEVWFDDVDEVLLEKDGAVAENNPEKFLVKEHGFQGLTKIIGMDCEMVGIGRGGEYSILARVSLVNHFGHCVYDTFVANTERVTDYRTHVSGVRPQDLVGAPSFKEVQQKVSEIIKGRILVGHALHHDLKVLYLDHPRKLIRDTSKYRPFRQHFGGKTPGLKKLSERYIGVKVQTGEHSSVQDAQAAVRLYTLVRTDWEATIMEKHARRFTGNGKKRPRTELNNKSSALTGIQAELSSSGTRRYVDSDSD